MIMAAGNGPAGMDVCGSGAGSLVQHRHDHDKDKPAPTLLEILAFKQTPFNFPKKLEDPKMTMMGAPPADGAEEEDDDEGKTTSRSEPRTRTKLLKKRR